MKRPTALAHVVLSLEVGGLERIVAALARRQRVEGVPVLVYCLDSLGAMAEELQGSGVPCRLVGRRSGIDWGLPIRLSRYFHRDSVRVVHAHNYSALVYAAPAAFLSGRRRVVYTAHGMNSARRRIQRRLQAAGLVHESVFVSHDSLRAALVSGAIDERHTCVVHNGIDMEGQLPSRSRSAVRESLGIGNHELVVGTLSRLSAVKRHVDLLEAHQLLVARGLDVRCLVVGGGELLEPLRESARTLGIESSVTFTDWRSDVPDVLSAMDVFVLPSDTEGLPVTVLEAMAQRLPVIATNVGGNAEVVVQGETGLLVPARNPAGLADAIVALVADSERRSGMGAAGLKRVRECFSLDSMAAGYRQVYERLFP